MKKSQISNELLLLFGLVIVVFGVLYSYNFYQSKNIDLVNRQFKLQGECNKLANEIMFVFKTGNGFIRNYAGKYDLTFIGSSRQLTMSDTVASATCKLPVVPFKDSGTIKDFSLGSGTLTIINLYGRVYVGLT